MATRRTTVSPTAAGFGQDAGQHDLWVETIRLAILSVVALAFCVLLVALFGLNDLPPSLTGVVVGLLLTAGTAHLAFRISPATAAGVVVCGLVALLAAGLLLLPPAAAAPWFSLAVLVAAALCGWRWGALVALTATAILVVAAQQPATGLAADTALGASLLVWLSLFASWLISRPVRTALDWAWSSYAEALKQTSEARQRQAELAQMAKSLDVAYYRLEQLTLELERARRRAEDARRLKEQFATAVSHELRTPLNLILGFCEMMVLAPSTAYGHRLPASYRGDLEAMYRNATHISSLVDDILDLSQIEADRMGLHKEWTALGETVGEAMTTVESLFRNRQLVLRRVLPDDLPPIFVDRTRVRQILINLLANAARFTVRGGATISAAVEDGTLVIGVSDTGPGIPAAELPHVFDEFYQVGGTEARRGGSGVGLTVSRRFAELHGGAMWVESTVGMGSTFFLKLPIAREGAPVSVHEGDWDARLGRRVHGERERRILVVDETREVLRVFQRYLDDYRVRHVDDVVADLGRGKPAPVDAIVLGSAAAEARWRALLQKAPELGDAPLISCVFHTRRWQADELGVADYLVKPVTRDQLRSAVRRLGRRVSSILVVDDDPGMMRLLTRMLRSVLHGCTIWTASNGQEALEAMRQRGPDLVLLDLLMPGTDGYGVLEAMRAEPALQRTPVVVVTARGLHDETVMASALSLSRTGGLHVGEAMRWVKAGLDALVAPRDSAPASPAGRSA